MQRILIVKTSSLGDVIHCLPVVNDILQHAQQVHIDWVVEESFADIPRLHPQVKNVLTVAMRRWRKALFSKNTWQEISEAKHLIQQNQYDAIIDTQGLLKSALIAKQAYGVKHGYDKNSIREPLASWFYDKTYAISYQQHAMTRNRALAAQSLGYSVPETPPDYGISSKKIQNSGSVTHMNIGLQDRYILALHGTSRESKLWPTENWVNLGKLLAQKNLNLALPWANEAEFKRANEISAQLDNASVLPKRSIAELASVISDAKAAIGVDTGLSHLAAALNIPTIAIYTDTDSALTGVMAGSQTQAINLGGIGAMPSVADVFGSLKKILE
ncbi:MAG: lipopolysaccharide heptosyltransferase I [Methylotenera sp.]